MNKKVQIIAQFYDTTGAPIPDLPITAVIALPDTLTPLGQGTTAADGSLLIDKPISGDSEQISVEYRPNPPSLILQGPPQNDIVPSVAAMGSWTLTGSRNSTLIYDFGNITWSNQPFFSRQLNEGTTLTFYGIDQTLYQYFATLLNQRRSPVLRTTAVDVQDQEGEGGDGDSIIVSIGEDIADAQQALAGSTVALGPVTLGLKLVPDEDGARLPTSDELGNLDSASLISVNINYYPIPPTTPAITPPTANPPNVVGYTQEIAINRMTQAGYKTGVQYQLVDPNSNADQLGRVITQTPHDKAPYVLLTVGKALIATNK